ncbi:MAG: hypothetical protein ACR2RA_05400 [Geminicoccaceae bacterium]
MSTSPKANAIEAVAVFHDIADLDKAVESLIKAGFDKEDVSLLASEATVEEKLGHRYERVEELEDDPNAPRVAYRPLADFADTERTAANSLTYLPAMIAAGTVVASAGVVAAAITGAAVGGAVLSTVLARWLDKTHADHLQEQLEHGGLLLWVNAPTEERQETAQRILKAHAATDVHVHDFAEAKG